MTESMQENKSGISDEAVRASTGKGWQEWFNILDEAGATGMSHKEIVAILSEQHQVGSWWQQMVTVAYEQARGLREKYETPQGYQVSRSKTIQAPAARAFTAWADKNLRWIWLPGAEIAIRKMTPDKSLRITWQDGSRVDVGLYPKGPDKCQVAISHNQLSDAEQVEQMKRFWGEALDRLKDLLED